MIISVVEFTGYCVKYHQRTSCQCTCYSTYSTQGTCNVRMWRLCDPWSQRNGERALLWMGGRVWLLLSSIRGPWIYKPDPAGVNIQNVIWERQSTVSANLFSTVIFGLKDWLQKVESSNYGWETKESRAWTLNLCDNQLVYRGFLNRLADRNIWFSSQMMASLMWSKRTYTTFILAIRIAIVQQNFRCFLR